jgi:hypothetical protein
VNVAALPYTLLLILAELAIGSLWITVASDLRGGVTRGFVMTMALCVAVHRRPHLLDRLPSTSPAR